MPLVGAIDEGTSSVRFLVFAAENAEVLTYHQIPIKLIYPKEGWVEQDPIEILEAVRECLSQTVVNLQQLTIDPSDIVAIGIANQRETTVVWSSITGEPLYNAISWMDMRTADLVDDILSNTINSNNNNEIYLKELSGLPISPYFSALKLKWLIDNVDNVKKAMLNGSLMFGTIDSWLIWNLTGGINGGAHSTDVTNASRTMLMNISTLQWDPTLLLFFDIPYDILPQIRSSSEIYGHIQEGLLKGVPISGCLGDQQSALIGEMCLQRGQAKSTYGTGCFLLYNTGETIVKSNNGLITTVAYQMGPKSRPVYALEGSIAIAGGVLDWLKDNLNMLDEIKDCEKIVEQIPGDNRIIFVPAFAGLYAPYWRKDATSIICGITEDTKKSQIIKAALQSVCFQIRDILEAMEKDTGLTLTKLLADGAMTNNQLLMQMQADICGIPIVRPLMSETTALGVAMAAGSAEGIKKWDFKIDTTVPSDTFLPSISDNDRDILYSKWKKAVDKSLEYQQVTNTNDNSPINYQNVTSAGLFAISTVMLLILAKHRLNI
ncbi:hypothetical protein HCN44_009003 [Aphidius gifuensis]|uniref:Probable glycerol kinase n=1 Tax=Aphidius gifuensis TaxID=684658 RepID=A0A834XMZ2_APHGI|nr:glycerol kinase-like [Aphidius gifuensis]KAF7990060.1 hypothetical protein HCN44_009003 [Aphidius gifuensis]